jgi:hypothetical protein
MRARTPTALLLTCVVAVACACASPGGHGRGDDGGVDGRLIYIAPVTDLTNGMGYGGAVWRQLLERWYQVAPRRNLVLFADGALALDVVIVGADDVAVESSVAGGVGVAQKRDLCLRATATLVERSGHVVLSFLQRACARYEVDPHDAAQTAERRRRAGDAATFSLSGAIVRVLTRVP